MMHLLLYPQRSSLSAASLRYCAPPLLMTKSNSTSGKCSTPFNIFLLHLQASNPGQAVQLFSVFLLHCFLMAYYMTTAYLQSIPLPVKHTYYPFHSILQKKTFTLMFYIDNTTYACRIMSNRRRNQ